MRHLTKEPLPPVLLTPERLEESAHDWCMLALYAAELEEADREVHLAPSCEAEVASVAVRLAQDLEALPGQPALARILHSPARRARESARLLADRFPDAAPHRAEIAELGEIRLGVQHTGVAFKTLARLFPAYGRAVAQRGYFNVAPPGGTSLAEHRDETIALLARLTRLPGTQLIITHGGRARLMLEEIECTPIAERERRLSRGESLPYGGYAIVAYDRGADRLSIVR
ncbi:MAG TPA: histidine phosphatase family protein [Candidatus Paceibacterota bacterium]|nr:histidine phosphatase family protein [Candidatus Paceibacterota bacterium]